MSDAAVTGILFLGAVMVALQFGIFMMVLSISNQLEDQLERYHTEENGDQ